MEDGGSTDLGDLAGRAKRREPRALAELFDAFFEKLRRYAYYQTGDLDRAEDIAADSIRAAIESLDRFDDRGGSLSAWMYGIARNMVARQLRDRGTRREVSIEQTPHLHSGEQPEESVLRELSYLELYAAVSRLPAEQREVIVLRYVEGYRCEEVGLIMGKRSGAVRGIQHRAIRSLRRALQAPGGEQDRPGDLSSPVVKEEDGLEPGDVT